MEGTAPGWLPRALALASHQVNIKLHKDVAATVNINVKEA